MSKKNLKKDTIKDVALRDLKRDIALHLPSALIILFYSNSWVENKVLSFVKLSKTLYEFLFDWQNFFHVPIIILAIVLPLLSKYMSASNIIYSGSEELRARISEGLNNVVNSKADRFRATYLKTKNSNVADKLIFNEITQPILQVKILSENLLVIFRDVIKSNDIKLTAINCKDNQMVNFVFHSDFEPNVSVSELNSNNSVAKKCITSKKSILYSNVDQNMESFYKGESNIGSIYCYPIHHSKEINFVLSFSSPNQNDLKKEYKRLYDDIISEFKNRYLIEWYLNHIKNKS